MTSVDTDRLNTFLGQYEQYVGDVLQPTQDELRAELAPWQHPEYWSRYKRTDRIPIPSPVRTAQSRIKRPEQVVDKIFRKPNEFPAGLEAASFRRMGDALGVRIVVYVLSHLPLIDRALRNSGLFEVAPHRAPTAYMSSGQAGRLGLDHLHSSEKESGYRSIHYLLRLTKSALPEQSRPWFEVQVRTIGQDLWSTMEHHLGYKPGKPTNMQAKRQFHVLSGVIGAIDDHFNLLYEELNRYQAKVSYGDADPLSPENLPPVLADIGISCAQRDINNILKFLYSRGVDTVRSLREIATSRRLEMIRNTFLSEQGRTPVNLEVIATLAALRGATGDEGDIRRVIQSQIAYRGAWDSIRREFTQG